MSARPPPPVGRRFEAGKSANPGGRSKAAAEIARLIRDRTRNGEELVEFALAVLRGRLPEPSADGSDSTFVSVPDDAKSRMFALQWLSDRGLGKPLQDIDIIISGSADLAPQDQGMLDALKLSPHARRIRAEELRAKMHALPEPDGSDDAG